jgi:hypothetical protein
MFVQFAFVDRKGTPYLSPAERAFHLGVLRIVLGLALCRPDRSPDGLRLSAAPSGAEKREQMLTINKNQAITKLNRLIEDGRQNAG